ncbi:MAG: FAD-dependent oxidoreductase [Nanoarchaeota archaeon]
MFKIVIIGLGTAGFAAALAAKKQDRNSEITFIDKKRFDLQHSCGLPYFLERKIHSISKLKHNINAEMMGMKIINNSQATKIDHKSKTVYYKNLENDQENRIDYDKLIISPGSYPFLPPIPGIDNNEYIFTLHNDNNAERLDKKIETSRSAIVIGAGAIGLETAYALKKRGLNTTIVDMLPHAFPKAIDPDISKILEDYLTEKGIGLRLGKRLEKIEKNNVYVEGEKITTDIIVMATGVRPCIKLAGDSGILTDNTGIVVNEKLETNIQDIYSAGDSITINSLITKKPFPAWLATTAYKQGTIAGINAVGGDKKIKGTAATFVSVIGDLEVAATGLNSYLAEQNNFEIVIGKTKSTDLPEWMPHAEELTVKVIADKTTGRLLGAQAIGKGAAARINVVSTAINAGMTLQKLSEVEFAYCPSVSQCYDVLTSAVDLAIRKIR